VTSNPRVKPGVGSHPTVERGVSRPRGGSHPTVILPTGFGINCEAETQRAFELAGAHVDRLHLNDLLDEPARLARAQILALAGGFSFGDHLGAGRVLANRLRCKLAGELDAFIADGGLVIGICNGFQTMVRLGILPSGKVTEQAASLLNNTHGQFYDGWVTLGADSDSPCLFTRGIERLEVPVRHGEGRLFLADDALDQAKEAHLFPLRYLDRETFEPSERFPDNPNGSVEQAAALCDPSGRLFGLMPHPEAFLYRENHPQWRGSSENRKKHGDGLQIFVNAVDAARGQ
jgi:phosphoribosylformylglycinamidine (FGAM) synthase-like amidotransferase family enzyme